MATTLPPTTNVTDGVAKAKAVKQAAIDKAQNQLGNSMAEAMAKNLMGLTKAMADLSSVTEDKIDADEKKDDKEQTWFDQFLKEYKETSEKQTRALTNAFRSFGKIFSDGIIGKLISYNPVFATMVSLLSDTRTTMENVFKTGKDTITAITTPFSKMVVGISSLAAYIKAQRASELEAGREKGASKSGSLIDGLLKKTGLEWLAQLADVIQAVIALAAMKLLPAIGTVIAGLGLLASGLAAFMLSPWIHWESDWKFLFAGFRHELKEIIHEMKHLKFAKTVSTVGTYIANATKTAKSTFDGLAYLLKMLGKIEIKVPVIDRALNTMKTFSKNFTGIFTQLSRLSTSYLGALSKNFTGIFTQLSRLSTSYLGALSNTIDDVRKTLTGNLVKQFKSFGTGVKSTIDTLSYIMKTLGSIKFTMPAGVLANATSNMKTMAYLMQVLGSVKFTLPKGTGTIAQSFANIGKSVMEYFKSWGSVFGGNFLEGATNKLKDGIKKLFESRIGKLMGFFGKLVVKLFGPITYILAGIEQLKEDWLGKIENRWLAGFSWAITTLMEGFSGFMNGLVYLVTQALVDIPTWLVGSLLSALGFDDIGAILRDTDFSGMLTKKITEGWEYLTDFIGSIFLSLDQGTFMADMMEVFRNIGGMISEMVMTNLIDPLFESITGLWDLIKEKLGGIAEWLGLDMPKGSQTKPTKTVTTLTPQKVSAATGILSTSMGEQSQEMALQRKRDFEKSLVDKKTAEILEVLAEKVLDEKTSGSGGGFFTNIFNNNTVASVSNTTGGPIVPNSVDRASNLNYSSEGLA